MKKTTTAHTKNTKEHFLHCKMFLHNNQRSVYFKMSFGCYRFDQKTNEISLRISALASKRGQIKKIKTLLY